MEAYYSNKSASSDRRTYSKRRILRWVVGLIIFVLALFFVVGYFVHRSTGLHEDNVKILNDRIVTDLENNI